MAAIHWCRNSGEVGKRSSANISHLQLSRGVLCCRHMLGPRTFLLRWLFVQLQSAQCRPIEHSQEYDILSAGQRNKRKNSGGVVDCADGWGTGNNFNSPVQDATLIFRVPSWSRWVEGERVKRSTGELIWSAVCFCHCSNDSSSVWTLTTSLVPGTSLLESCLSWKQALPLWHNTCPRSVKKHIGNHITTVQKPL